MAPPIVEEFRAKLKDEWKQVPLCNHPPESDHDVHQYCDAAKQHTFYNTVKMERWLRSKTNNGQTNMEQLLVEVAPIKLRQMPFEDMEIKLEGPKCCVRVFGLLLSLDAGNLIQFFRRAEVFDNNLLEKDLAPKSSQRKALIERLVEKAKLSEDKAQKLITKFEHKRWQFPEAFEFDMEQDFDHKYRLPFVTREKIGNGGTASVFQVLVQKDFLSEELQRRLGSSFNYSKFGQCYEMAVKSYSKNQEHVFKREKHAFKGLRDKPGIVRCFGCYEQCVGYRDETKFHILLEFGKSDVAEYFSDILPPQLPLEIFEFWKSICMVAKAIHTFHELSYNEQIYNGWHGDVKPGNILLVQNEFKLADFGFAEFERNIEGATKRPRKSLEGGTLTYGAPEFVQTEPDLNEVPQTIDTWSFGCVLSVAATWVVFGIGGIGAFEECRRIARRKVTCDLTPNKQEQGIDTDAFHDGKRVLPAVREWHTLVKENRRKPDVVTSDILDLVDKHLLIKERLSSKELCDELEIIIDNAGKSLTDKTPCPEIPDYMKQALLRAELARPMSLSKDSSHSTDMKLTTTTASLDGDLLRVPIIQTSLQSNRSRVRSKFSSQIPSTSYREETLRKDLEKSGLISTPETRDKDSISNNAQGKQRMLNPNTLSSYDLKPKDDDHGDSDTETSSRSPTLVFSRILEEPISSPSTHHPPTIWDIIEGGDSPAAIFSLGKLLEDKPKLAKSWKNGLSPLMLAAKNYDLELVRLLLQVSEIDQRDTEGKTVLHHAVMRPSSRDDEKALMVVKELTRFAKDRRGDLDSFVNMLDHMDRSPLYYCITGPGLKKTADHLINCDAWVIPPPESKMMNFYIQAVEEDKIDMVELLLSKEPKLIDQDLSVIHLSNGMKKLLLKKTKEGPKLTKDERSPTSGKSRRPGMLSFKRAK